MEKYLINTILDNLQDVSYFDNIVLLKSWLIELSAAQSAPPKVEKMITMLTNLQKMYTVFLDYDIPIIKTQLK